MQLWCLISVFVLCVVMIKLQNPLSHSVRCLEQIRRIIAHATRRAHAPPKSGGGAGSGCFVRSRICLRPSHMAMGRAQIFRYCQRPPRISHPKARPPARAAVAELNRAAGHAGQNRNPPTSGLLVPAAGLGWGQCPWCPWPCKGVTRGWAVGVVLEVQPFLNSLS